MKSKESNNFLEYIWLKCNIFIFEKNRELYRYKISILISRTSFEPKIAVTRETFKQI